MGTSETYNTPDTDEVLQEDERDLAIPVTIDGVVRTDEMPTRLGMLGNRLLPVGGTAVSLLPANPRRKRVLLWITVAGTAPADTVIGALLGESVSDISGFTGPVLLAGTVYEFTFQSELYARGVDIENTTGTFDGINGSSNEVIVHILTEDWAR